MTAVLTRPATPTDRAPQVNDRVRWPGTSIQPAWVGTVSHFPTDPIDTGIAVCKVPGIGYVRVQASRLQVLGGAR